MSGGGRYLYNSLCCGLQTGLQSVQLGHKQGDNEGKNDAQNERQICTPRGRHSFRVHVPLRGLLCVPFPLDGRVSGKVRLSV